MGILNRKKKDKDKNKSSSNNNSISTGGVINSQNGVHKHNEQPQQDDPSTPIQLKKENSLNDLSSSTKSNNSNTYYNDQGSDFGSISGNNQNNSNNNNNSNIKVKKNVAVTIPTTKRLLESERNSMNRKMSNAAEVELYHKLKQRENDFAQSLTCAISPFQYLNNNDQPDKSNTIDDFKIELSFDGYSNWYRDMRKKVREKYIEMEKKSTAETTIEEKKNSFKLGGRSKKKKKSSGSLPSPKSPSNGNPDDELTLHLDFLRRHFQHEKSTSNSPTNTIKKHNHHPSRDSLSTTPINNITLSSSSSGGLLDSVNNNSLSVGNNNNNNGNTGNGNHIGLVGGGGSSSHSLNGEMELNNNNNNNNIGNGHKEGNGASHRGSFSDREQQQLLNGINMSSNSIGKDDQSKGNSLQTSQDQSYTNYRLPRRLNSSQSIIQRPISRKLNTSGQNINEEDSISREESYSIDSSYFIPEEDESAYSNGSTTNSNSNTLNPSNQNSKYLSTSPNSQVIKKIGKIFSFFSSSSNSSSPSNSKKNSINLSNNSNNINIGNQGNNNNQNNQNNGGLLSVNGGNNTGVGGTHHFITRTHSQSSLQHSPRMLGDINNGGNGGMNGGVVERSDHQSSPPPLNRSQSHISLQSKSPRTPIFDGSPRVGFPYSPRFPNNNNVNNMNQINLNNNNGQNNYNNSTNFKNNNNNGFNSNNTPIIPTLQLHKLDINQPVNNHHQLHNTNNHNNNNNNSNNNTTTNTSNSGATTSINVQTSGGQNDTDSENTFSSSPSSTPSTSPTSSPETSPEPSPRQQHQPLVFFRTIHIQHPKKTNNSNTNTK